MIARPDVGPRPIHRFSQLFSYQKNDPDRHLVVVIAGQIGRLLIGLVSSALLARALEPEGWRVFSLVGAVLAISITIADFGLSNAAVHFVARDLAGVPERSKRSARAYVALKILTSLVVFCLILAFADRLAHALKLPPSAGPWLLRLAGAGVLATSFSGSITTVLRALRRFERAVLTSLANGALTVILLGMLALTHRLTIASALVAGAATAMLAGVTGVFLLPGRWRSDLTSPGGSLRPEANRLLRVSRWLWLSAVLGIFHSQLDLLLVNLWLPARIVGLYALALNLAFKADIVNQAFHLVLLPSVAALEGTAGYRPYIRRSLVRSVVFTLVLLLGISLTPFLIPAVYGPLFGPSVGIFLALVTIVIFDMFTSPILLLAYPLRLPHIIALADAVRVVALVVLAGPAIPAMGAYGAVAAKLSAHILGAGVLGFAIYRRLRAGAQPKPSMRQAP